MRTALRSEDLKVITSPIENANRREQVAASAAVECCCGRGLICRRRLGRVISRNNSAILTTVGFRE
jgi:hypothetical protein